MRVRERVCKLQGLFLCLCSKYTNLSQLIYVHVITVSIFFSPLPVDFHKLWLQILRYIELYLKVDRNAEVLAETVRESLKNMILVMSAAGVSHTSTHKDDTHNTHTHFNCSLAKMRES